MGDAAFHKVLICDGVELGEGDGVVGVAAAGAEIFGHHRVTAVEIELTGAPVFVGGPSPWDAPAALAGLDGVIDGDCLGDAVVGDGVLDIVFAGGKEDAKAESDVAAGAFARIEEPTLHNEGRVADAG